MLARPGPDIQRISIGSFHGGYKKFGGSKYGYTCASTLDETGSISRENLLPGESPPNFPARIKRAVAILSKRAFVQIR